MSTLDDVHADLTNRPPLTRRQMDQIVNLLDRSGIDNHRPAVAVTLRSMLPSAGQRLASVSAAQATEYLRVLKTVMIEMLAASHPQ
jgi:hypothetical protein